MSFAIIETGGKQYKVKAGEILKVEKLMNVLFFSSHWEVGSSMNCFVTEGGGGGSGGGAEEVEAEQENSHFLQ